MFVGMSTLGQSMLIMAGVILFVLLIVLLWAVTTNNTFKKMKIKIEESESSIDVALTKRYDLLTKMVQATKSYMKHEKETLAGIVELRKLDSKVSINEKSDYANKLAQGMSAINVIAENYPELKASQNFVKLQEATMEVEENLQASRRVYNSNVSIYNQKLVIFPSNIIASSKKYTKKDFFEAEVSKKQDVNLEF